LSPLPIASSTRLANIELKGVEFADALLMARSSRVSGFATFEQLCVRLRRMQALVSAGARPAMDSAVIAFSPFGLIGVTEL